MQKGVEMAEQAETREEKGEKKGELADPKLSSKLTDLPRGPVEIELSE